MYSELLARQVGARVVGVEPSRRMREIAERDHAQGRLRWVRASAYPTPRLAQRVAEILVYRFPHEEPAARYTVKV